MVEADMPGFEPGTGALTVRCSAVELHVTDRNNMDKITTADGHEYAVLGLVAVQWNPAMAEQFPNAEHHHCRQEMFHTGKRWMGFTPAHCLGYHCPRCGAATNSYGHRDCGAL